MTEHRIDPVILETAIKGILLADRCTADEAAEVARHLVEASLSGHDSHGVIRIIRYHGWLKDGTINAATPLNVLLDSGVMLHLDGNDGMGQWLAREATAMGIARAREQGIGFVALRRAGHLGRAGAYAEQACAAGLVSIHFVNVGGSLLVAPFGTARRCAGTNPIAIGIPDADGDDFILDFATSLVAEGKALVAGTGGKPLPADALSDAEGRPTGDPRVLYGNSLDTGQPDPHEGSGALRAMGDHKGSGLALACELLAGALTGNGTNGTGDRPFGNGMLSIFIDPVRFDDLGGFGAEISDYLAFVRSSPPAPGTEQVLAPGDKERATRTERSRNGLPMTPAILDGISAILGETGVGIGRDDLILT